MMKSTEVYLWLGRKKTNKRKGSIFCFYLLSLSCGKHKLILCSVITYIILGWILFFLCTWLLFTNLLFNFLNQISVYPLTHSKVIKNLPRTYTRRGSVSFNTRERTHVCCSSGLQRGKQQPLIRNMVVVKFACFKF